MRASLSVRFHNTVASAGTHHSCLCEERKVEGGVLVQKQGLGPVTVHPERSDVVD